MKKSFLKYIAIIIAVIFADVISKGILLYLITGAVPVSGPAWSVVPVPYLMAHVCDIFNIVFTWNPGASFSLFRAIGDSAPIVMIIATAFIIGFIGYYLFMRSQTYERLPLALIMGGAIGNLIDRVRFGAVVDFLDFHGVVFEYINAFIAYIKYTLCRIFLFYTDSCDLGSISDHYPAFNFADICIVVGVGLYLLNWYLARRRCMRCVEQKGKK